MDRTGDTRTTWSKTVRAEVDAAKAMFNSMKAKGYLAYTVEPGGGRGEVIRDFDPNAEAIIMSPQTVGG
jgi:hypothetical protein